MIQDKPMHTEQGQQPKLVYLKRCSQCGQRKPREDFNRDRGKRDGLRYNCRACESERRGEFLDSPERHARRLESSKKGYKKHRSTPKGRVDANLSSNLRSCMTKKGTSKGGRKWETLVGYSVDTLMRRLESKFQSGMTWENYGLNGWHIDHIIPKSWFFYESPDDWQFKVCWSLANLQPMWAYENRSKCNRRAG